MYTFHHLVCDTYYHGENGSDFGHVQIYTHTGDSRVKVGNCIDRESINDISWYSVPIYSDGKTVAVFGTHNDRYVSNTFYMHGIDHNNGSLVEVGDNIYGEMKMIF